MPTAPARKHAARFAGDPVRSATVLGLCYVSDSEPGIQRRRNGRGFIYIGPDGRAVHDEEELARIRKLVIPPAWQDVWISASRDGHLQAVGRDAKGRKQYRYHPAYRQFRNQTKFDRLTQFAAALPLIRRHVEEDLRLRGLPRNKVLATVVRLLETTFARVGNHEYARNNGSYGLTTLRDRHVDVEGSILRFEFRGKSGQVHQLEVNDPRAARIIKRCRDLSGYELFQYIDGNGERCRISSSDVNDYLREITGQDFTAKDFRTWAGTVSAALALQESGPSGTGTELKRNVVAAIKRVAERLGNRPATCRNYYVHPAVIDAYSNGGAVRMSDTGGHGGDSSFELSAEEKAVVRVIERQAESGFPALTAVEAGNHPPRSRRRQSRRS